MRHQLVDAVVEPLAQQVGEQGDREPGVLQGDPGLVGQPDPDHVVHQGSQRNPQRVRRRRVGRDHPRGHHVGAGPEPLGAQVGRDAGQVAEVDVHPAPGGERAAGPAPPAADQAGVLQPVQHLPDRGPADPVHLGQLPLGGQAAVTAERVGGEQRAEPLFDQAARALAAGQQGDAVRLVQMGAHKVTIDRQAGGSAGRRQRACPADQRRRRPLRGDQRDPGRPHQRVHLGSHRRTGRRLQRVRAQGHVRPARGRPAAGGRPASGVRV